MEPTARDLGPKGYDRRYGWGLLDAAAATAPPPRPARRRDRRRGATAAPRSSG